MHETLIESPHDWEASEGIRASALRAEAWAGEPFLRPDDDSAASLKPGSAVRRALDDAIVEMDAGLEVPLVRVEGALRAHARARARPLREAAAPRLRHRAAPPPGGRARRDAHRADRRGREAERQRQRGDQRLRRRRGARRGRGGGRGRHPRRARRRRRARRPPAAAARGPGRRAALPLPPPDRLRQDDRGRRLRRGRTHRRRADPHPPPPARRPVPARAHRPRLRRALHRRDPRPANNDRALEPDHDPDLRLVRPSRRRDLAHRLPARDLRRGAHRARREDLRGDPQPERADLHRHDGDRGADREAGLRRLPRLGRRPSARRRRAPRADRPAPLPARPAGRGDQLGADRRRRLRGARPRRRPRPRGA